MIGSRPDDDLALRVCLASKPDKVLGHLLVALKDGLQKWLPHCFRIRRQTDGVLPPKVQFRLRETIARWDSRQRLNKLGNCAPPLLIVRLVCRLLVLEHRIQFVEQRRTSSGINQSSIERAQ